MNAVESFGIPPRNGILSTCAQQHSATGAVLDRRLIAAVIVIGAPRRTAVFLSAASNMNSTRANGPFLPLPRKLLAVLARPPAAAASRLEQPRNRRRPAFRAEHCKTDSVFGALPHAPWRFVRCWNPPATSTS